MTNCDYHIHTWRCNHAKGDVDEYCEVALERGLVKLGISDHTPLPDNRWLFRRMTRDQLTNYIESIDKAQRKYSHMSILKSMECDYVQEYVSYYQDELLGRRGCNYLIGAVHWFPTNDGWVEVSEEGNEKQKLLSYTNLYIEGISQQMFSFMAHPDIFGSFYLEWDSEAISCSRAILQAAKCYCVPLEVNSRGLRKSRVRNIKGPRPKYPIVEFWELAAEYDIKVVINSDAHAPDELTVGIHECRAMVDRMGLKIVEFPFRYGPGP